MKEEEHKNSFSDEGCTPICRAENGWKKLELDKISKILNVVQKHDWCDSCNSGSKCENNCPQRLFKAFSEEYARIGVERIN